MPTVDSQPTIQDDGQFTPEVGEWAERKYRLIAYYAEMFATSMKAKWASRVYIDLFAGAGRGRIKGMSRIVETSTMLALGVRNPFDRYIFCDIDPGCIGALRARVGEDHRDLDVRLLTGDSNDLVDEILGHVPAYRPGKGVLSFCVLDPYNLGNLKFETFERLSSIFVDFLVLISSHMDGNRNERLYTAPDNTTLAEFLGKPDWRDEWSNARGRFGNFIVDQFGKSMSRLGFGYDGPQDVVQIKYPQKNVTLYHLAFFSKSELGRKFWRQARKYSDDQLDLFG